MSLNKVMLPANVTANDRIFIDEKVKRPIAIVIKKPPKLLETVPTSLSDNDTEETKEISADAFPKLRGFV